MPSEPDYPLGARWEAVDSTGKKAIVWLDAVGNLIEVWRWRVVYSDGSASAIEHNWANSKRQAVEDSRIYLRDSVRFKRMNKQDDKFEHRVPFI